MKKSINAFIFIFLFFAIIENPSNAFVRTLGYDGKQISWFNGSVSFVANPTNNSGLNSTEIETIFRNSFNEWMAANAAMQYSYSQSTGISPVSANDGRNTIYFASAGGRNLDFNVIAVTEVTYYVSSGQIAGADMVFNDQNFYFTSNSGDTGKFANGKMKIFLGDVATHEIGHAWGIDHSTVHRSSMIYTAFTGQSRAGADDKSAITTLYPAPGMVAAKGSIVGNIKGLNGGIFGAHVSAINLEKGDVEAGVLANSDGSFRIGDLPTGKYVVFMEPFLVSTSSISLYWDSIDHRFCSGGKNFRRAFYSRCGANGEATVVEVKAGEARAIGAITPSCEVMANSGDEPGNSANPQVFTNSGGAMFHKMQAGQSHYYKINGVQGKLTARVISYTLFSPLDVEVEIFDENFQQLPGAVSMDDVESPMPGGVNNYNAFAEATNLANGNYIIRVRSKGNFLSSGLYPAGGQLLDANGFYLLSLSVNDNFPVTGITDMNACVTVNNVPQSPVTFAVRERSGSEIRDGSSCATITHSGGPFDGGDSNLLFILATSLLSILYYRARLLALQLRNR